jgi:phosphatidylglycerophosphate synthase
VLDFSDGIIARYNGISTFYGRFLDSILDIFIESFLILSISYFVFNIYLNPNILIVGIITSIFSIYSTCIHDKYASLVRWSNEENKTEIIPYLRKNRVPRVGYTLLDLQHVLIFAMPFFLDNTFILSKLFFTFIIITLSNYILNIFKHIFSAKKNLNINAKDKKLYTKNE